MGTTTTHAFVPSKAFSGCQHAALSEEPARSTTSGRSCIRSGGACSRCLLASCGRAVVLAVVASWASVTGPGDDDVRQHCPDAARY